MPGNERPERRLTRTKGPAAMPEKTGIAERRAPQRLPTRGRPRLTRMKGPAVPEKTGIAERRAPLRLSTRGSTTPHENQPTRGLNHASRKPLARRQDHQPQGGASAPEKVTVSQMEGSYEVRIRLCVPRLVQNGRLPDGTGQSKIGKSNRPSAALDLI